MKRLIEHKLEDLVNETQKNSMSTVQTVTLQVTTFFIFTVERFRKRKLRCRHLFLFSTYYGKWVLTTLVIIRSSFNKTLH